MEYQISKTVKGTLRENVSPKALKFFKDNELFSKKTDAELQTALFELILTEDKFNDLMNCVFSLDGEVKFDYDVDYYEIIKGLNDFFVKLTPPSPK